MIIQHNGHLRGAEIRLTVWARPLRNSGSADQRIGGEIPGSLNGTKPNMKSVVFLRGFDMFVPRSDNLRYKDSGN